MSTGADATSRRARITGIVYLLYFLTAGSGEALVGRGRPVAFELFDLMAHAFYMAVTLLFYFLFRPVNRSVSALAVAFGLGGCANDVLNILGLAPYKISSLVFFGPYCFLIGCLIFRSGFLPRILGVLMASAGVAWLIVLAQVAGQLAPYLTILGFLAEASLMLWLIVTGAGRRAGAPNASDR
jgi:hypothetical protein